MNNKIKNYVEVLFSDIPRSKKANELKEELLSNMSERFDDSIKDGKTENQAYSLVISSLGNVDEMLADVMPGDEFIKEANRFRKKFAKNTAISVALYIIGAAFFLSLGGIGLHLDKLNTYGLVGLVGFLLISSVATGNIVYTNMSIPLEYKDFNRKTKIEFGIMDSKHSKLYDNIVTIYWIIVTVIYLIISFTTWLWGITWIIMAAASVFPIILKIIFEKKYGDDQNVAL